MMDNQPILTRRGFVKAGGALLVTAGALPEALAPGGATVSAAALDATRLASWIEIKDDGTVVVRTGKAEMGVHMAAYYRQIVAEELDLNPDAISLVMGDTDRTPDGGWSASFIDGAQNLRKVAAYTRGALLGLAAKQLGSPVEALQVSTGVVSAAGVTRTVAYADIVRGQQLELTIPVSGGPLGKMNPAGTAVANGPGLTVTGTPQVKPVSQYRVVGTSYSSPSVADKVTAKTEWVGDVRLPGMLHARMVRPATMGSTLVSVGALDRQRFPTAELVRKGNLVAVVSPSEWEAVSAARAVAASTKWTEWAGLPGSGEVAGFIKMNCAAGPGRGDEAKTAAAFTKAAKVVSVSYQQPFVKHAPIGPYIAVADVKADGTTTVWTHSAQSQGLRAHLSLMLGVDSEKVTVRWLEGSGQYGRTSQGGDGAEADAVILSQLLRAPVRVQWTLQEDFAWSSASPAWTADLRAALDANGKLLALQSDFYSVPSDIRMVGAVLAGLPDVPIGNGGAGPATFGVGAVGTPYDVPAMFHRGYGMKSIGADAPSGVGLRGNIMRTPMQRQHVFALESLLNETAAAAGKDAIQFRLEHTSDRRLADLLKKTADAVGWQSRPSPNPGARRTGDTPVRGRGVAAMYRFGAYWVGVAEVEVTPSTGVVKIVRYTAGVDVGKVLNPRHLKLIVQGGAVMGISEVMNEELTFNAGAITSTDWSRYKIMTMGDTPDIQIVTLERDDVGFGGGGEAANGLPQPAIVAAIFDATGVMPRRTPLAPPYVKGLLANA